VGFIKSFIKNASQQTLGKIDQNAVMFFPFYIATFDDTFIITVIISCSILAFIPSPFHHPYPSLHGLSINVKRSIYIYLRD